MKESYGKEETTRQKILPALGPYWIRETDRMYTYTTPIRIGGTLFKDKKPLQSHNISISGGTNKLKFYFRQVINSEEGMYRRNTDKFRRINFHFKDFQILLIGLTLVKY